MDGHNAQSAKAVPIELKPSSQTSEVVRQTIAACLDHINGNIGNLCLHADAVHQTRVGLRRARSALRLFKEHIDKKENKRLNRELRTLGVELGERRDWDVFLAVTLPRIAKHTHLDLEQVRRRAVDQRLSIDKGIPRATWEPIAGRLEGLSLRGDELEDRIEETAPDMLDRVSRRVKRACRHLDTPEQRHALRKAMKKLRYSVEFLSSIYKDKAVKSYLHHCKEAQSILGEMNDAMTTVRLCQQLDAPDLDSVMAWALAEQKMIDGQMGTVLREFRTAKPFWD